MREFFGVVLIYTLLVMFVVLLAPYLYLHALRAATWYGATGAVVFSVGVAVCLVGSLLAWRKVR